MGRSADQLSAKRHAYRRGHRAEWFAIAFLMLKGWRILARRYGGKGGEIDLIMKRGQTVIFVEVKARATFEEGLNALTFEKQKFYGRVVKQWLSRNPWGMSCTLRADLVVILPKALPKHIENAFPLDAG